MRDLTWGRDSSDLKPMFESAEDFDVAEDILKWFTEQVTADEIENVTEEMVEKIVSGDSVGGQKATGVIFCEYLKMHLCKPMYQILATSLLSI